MENKVRNVEVLGKVFTFHGDVFLNLENLVGLGVRTETVQLLDGLQTAVLCLI